MLEVCKKGIVKGPAAYTMGGEASSTRTAESKRLLVFSYACIGMNFKDILTLKNKNIQGDTLIYQRAKTERTSRKQAPVKIYLNDFFMVECSTKNVIWVLPILEHPGFSTAPYSGGLKTVMKIADLQSVNYHN